MKSKTWLWIARHLPKMLVYWCGIILWANATTGKYGNELATSTMMRICLDRWEKK